MPEMRADILAPGVLPSVALFDAAALLDLEIVRLEALAEQGDAEALARFLESDLPDARDQGRPTSIPDVIRWGMEQQETVRIDYQREYDGVRTTYRAQPYEEKTHDLSGRLMLYASETNTHGLGQIHSFAWDRIQGAETVPGAHFAPIWPVPPASVP